MKNGGDRRSCLRPRTPFPNTPVFLLPRYLGRFSSTGDFRRHGDDAVKVKIHGVVIDTMSILEFVEDIRAPAPANNDVCIPRGHISFVLFQCRT
jgi:hypothetical protein